MIGICSIKNCENWKVHEDFEGIKSLIICWQHGDLIKEVLKELENNK